jgi:hypothetical protein
MKSSESIAFSSTNKGKKRKHEEQRRGSNFYVINSKSPPQKLRIQTATFIRMVDVNMEASVTKTHQGKLVFFI